LSLHISRGTSTSLAILIEARLCRPDGL